ncbi:Putative tubby-like protein [Septoria linicola]|uniref:Tubby-like protein n=1 Tax=Septoria linicola TaxID=215465 RepID=A0A9Q9B996_9PEZI|nr:putative tubby-like protein [Septoria linicola]USW59406.1 Putative tubby-like protein [Septoria linicola]
MTPELTAIKFPIAIRTEHIVTQQTTFRIQQHGKGLNSGNFTIFEPDDKSTGNKSGSNATPQQPLLQVDGKYGKLDERRSFSDASGLPLFELYHKAMGVTCMLKDNMDVSVRSAVPGEVDIVLQVRGQDIWKQRTNVYLGDKVIMTTKRTDKLSVYLPGKKLEWDVEIAAGMDISLASVIVVVLAANMYNSSMQASSSK